MKYTLAENAVSSLSISIENFKKAFYCSGKYTSSQIYEFTKICIVFLENSIELLLKSILASNNPTSIYKDPSSKTIISAIERVTDTQKLEDILISEGNFQTIRYSDTLNRYNESYHNSQKLFCILKQLGNMRNAITHFGINKDDYITFSSIVNAYDIVYNYLYPQLLELEDVAYLFYSDNIFVDTIHGIKPLLDENKMYNNILDFLDELLCEYKELACIEMAKRPESKISDFANLMRTVFDDIKLINRLKEYNAFITEMDFCYEKNRYSFDMYLNNELWARITSTYSPYFNATAFVGESGEIYFIIIHNSNEIYIYNSYSSWPEPNEPEPDELWKIDMNKGLCSKYNLSKRNLILAFESIIINWVTEEIDLSSVTK